MKKLPPLPPELSAGPFSVSEARRAGVSAARLRRGDLQSPFRGTRTALGPLTALDRAYAYAPNLREGQVFSHVTAALLGGLWLPRRCLDSALVDVLSLGGRDRAQAKGVRGHRAIDEEVAFARGLPVVSPVRTWVALAPLLSIDELVAAGDCLLRRNRPLATRSAMTAGIRQGERGASKARQALPLVRERVDSPKETELRLLFHRAGLPEPEVNGQILLAVGDTPGDLVFRAWRVLAEFDGQQHRVGRAQFERDIVRLEALARAGWIVIRVLDAHLQEPIGVVDRVVTALRDNGWRGRLSRGEFLRQLRASR